MTDPPSYPPHFPAPGTTVHRTTARVLPVDEQDRVLLMHGWEPRSPDRSFWFTIGGAAEDGETLPEAAVRELAEEVGITATPGELGDPLATYDNVFDWGEWHVVQTETYYAVRVHDVAIDLSGLDAMEQATTDRADWWTADDLDDDGSAANDHLATMVRAAVIAVRDRGPGVGRALPLARDQGPDRDTGG